MWNRGIQSLRNIWDKFQLTYLLIGSSIGFVSIMIIYTLTTEPIELFTGIVPEAIGITFTVFILERLNRRTLEQQRKLELFDQVKSRSNDMAVDALEKIQWAGWLDDMLNHYRLDNGVIDLGNIRWAGGVELSNINLTGAWLFGAILRGARLEGANLSGARLEVVDLSGALLKNANLSKTGLAEADLSNSMLQGADLSNAHLWKANLSNALLEDTNLSNTNMASANLRGSIFWRTNLSEVGLAEADLSNSMLQGANLSNADLWGVNLQGVKFDEATILPDEIMWSKETEMKRYTDPDHPDFWQPKWVTEDPLKPMNLQDLQQQIQNLQEKDTKD